MPELSLEVPASIGIALKSFQVMGYEIVDVTRPPVRYQYTAATTVGESEITVGLIVAALGTPGDLNDVVAKFETLTTVSVVGLELLPHPEKDTIVIPDPVIANIINIAVGTSRGALVVKSDGRFLIPLVDVTSLIPKTNKTTLVSE